MLKKNKLSQYFLISWATKIAFNLSMLNRDENIKYQNSSLIKYIKSKCLFISMMKLEIIKENYIL